MKKTIAIIGILAASATTWSQSTVYDPTVASLIVQTHNIQYELQHWMAELQSKQYGEEQKTNQYLDYMKQVGDEQLKRMGDPAAAAPLGISAPMPSSLEVSLIDQVKDEAKKEMSQSKEKTGLDKDTELRMRTYKKALAEVLEQQEDNNGKRGTLILQLDNAVSRLREAKTDADVQKINGEINAIQTALLALEHEMKEQERTLQMVQATTEEEELRKMAIEEQKQAEKESKARAETHKKYKEWQKKREENPTDTSNPLWYEDGSGFQALMQKMADNAKKGDFSGEGLSLPGSPRNDPKKPKTIPLSALGYDETTSDETAQAVIEDYKEYNITIIDDRKKSKD